MGQLELWIGPLNLSPMIVVPTALPVPSTNIVTWASDQESFRQKAEIIASTLDMFVVDVGVAEPVAERAEKWSMTEETDDMIQRAEVNPDAIVYGTFHRYPHDEA